MRQGRAMRSVEEVILVEGRYDEAGQTRLIPLEGDMNLPFAVVESGIHQVRLQ